MICRAPTSGQTCSGAITGASHTHANGHDTERLEVFVGWVYSHYVR